MYHSDTDIEADDLRHLGPIRTTYKGLINIMRRRVYTARIHLRLTPSDYTHGAAAAAAQGGHGGAGGGRGGGDEEAAGGGRGGERSKGPLVRDLKDSDDLEDGWKILEGSFLLVWAMTVSHASTDLRVAPRKCAGDGSVDVVLVRYFSTES